jgi:hypothetical protein
VRAPEGTTPWAFRRRVCAALRMCNGRIQFVQTISDSFTMSRPLVICAAFSMWLSTVALDRAKAIGTFRLEGPWPISSAQSGLMACGISAGAAEHARDVLLHKHRQPNRSGGPDHL